MKSALHSESAKSRIAFFTALKYIDYPKTIDKGRHIGDNLYLSSNINNIQPYLTQDVIHSIGNLEYEYLKKCQAFIYSIEETNDNLDLISYLTGKLNQVKYFHNCLWVASDNSIDNELGFLVVKNGNKFQTCSNFIANNFSNAEGLHIPTKLTDDLFNISRKVFNAFIVNKAPGDPSTTNFQKNVPRLYRAHYSIQAARSAPDIAERIAFYCTALETLFSTNSAELSHQLSERTAVFLSNDPETRLEIYKNVKAAYSIRSKSVHGDVIKNTNEQLMETSKSIDEILRACFVTAISNREASQAFDSSNELLDGYMIGLIFGGRRCPAENTES